MIPNTSLRLADALADDILSGSLPPGSRLEEAALAARFGCSRTPVREALAELCARGLAVRRPSRGVEVIRPDAELLLNRFEALAEIEGLCAGLAAHRGTMEEVIGLEMLLERMELAGLDEYRALNAELHDHICAMAGNPELVRVAQDLRLRLAALRGAQLRSPPRKAQSQQEHRAIVQAIAARNAEEARLLMRDHLRAAARASLAVLAPGAKTR